MPTIRLQFDKGFKYIGSQNVIIYGRAHAEQHFFVDADEQGRMTRLYWVQFEGYLPSNTYTYRYNVNKTVDVGGLEFMADAEARNTKGNGTDPPDSDGYLARLFLKSKGYRMPSDGFLWQRLVHSADEAKRNEFMIIYIEDLSVTGPTASDLAAGGPAATRWDAISTGLLERALKGMEALRQGSGDPPLR